MRHGPWWSSLFSRPPHIKSLLLWLAPVCIGCAAALLAYAANCAFSFFTACVGRWWWWPFLSLPAGGMLLTLYMIRSGKGAEGSGIPQALAAQRVADDPARMSRLVTLRLALVKFLSIVGGMASGFVLGLEGPTVQIGASIFYSFRRFLSVDGPLQRRQIILAGAAAGIASAFNAPLAGLIFAFEEMSSTIKGHTPAKLVIAVILAGMVAGPIFGYQSYFGRVPVHSGMPLHLLPLVAVIALAGGVIGGAFSWLAIRTHVWLPLPVRRWCARHPYLFVAVCGLLIAAAGMGAPIYGSGAELTKEVLAGKAELSWQYLPLKFSGLLLTFLTGLPGGIFSPSLSIGAGLGSYFLPFVDPLWQTEITAVGMVAVLSAVTRAPLTSAFIMIEMTDGHSMVLQALAAAFIAAWAARFFRVRIYHELAARMLH